MTAWIENNSRCDMPIVKLFEVGYKRTGDIQAVKIRGQASAGVVIAPGSTMKKIYQSKWQPVIDESILSGQTRS